MPRAAAASRRSSRPACSRGSRAAEPDRADERVWTLRSRPETPIDGSMLATPSMPLTALSSLNATSVEPSSDVPSGASRCTIHSPMSSSGTNSRPTMRFNGNAQERGQQPRSDDGAADGPAPSSACACTAGPASGRNPIPSTSDRPRRRTGFRKRELSIGVSVKLTSIDTRIANAIVQPNGLMNRLA